MSSAHALMGERFCALPYPGLRPFRALRWRDAVRRWTTSPISIAEVGRLLIRAFAPSSGKFLSGDATVLRPSSNHSPRSLRHGGTIGARGFRFGTHNLSNLVSRSASNG
jgi:hypothetical protein